MEDTVYKIGIIELSEIMKESILDNAGIILTVEQSKNVVKAMIKTIEKEVLERGNEIVLYKFGKFYVKYNEGRTMAFGKPCEPKKTYTLGFKASNSLKQLRD